MTTTTPDAVTVSSSTDTKRKHRKKGLPSVGLRAAVRGASATTARHVAFTALAGRTHLGTTETQR